MERYPMLALVLRFGSAGAALLALFALAVITGAGWATHGVVAAIVGAVVGATLYVGVRSFVELVRIVTEMLVPR